MAEDQWQIGKSVLECNRYMLQEQIDCNITFNLITGEGSQKNLGAHRYILLSRSPVLEALVSERWKEGKSKVIKIDEVEYDVFLEFIRFVYCEKCDINPSNVLPLLYTAKKYMIRQLEDKCTEYLARHVDANNVCELLEQSLLYGADKCVSQCITVINRNAGRVLLSKPFLSLSRSTVLKIVKNEGLRWNEREIANACVKWAVSTINSQKKDVNDDSLRQTLGPILYKIRFPLFSSSEFTESFFGTSTLLTKDEKLDIYQHICSNGKTKSRFFSHRCRIYPY